MNINNKTVFMVVDDFETMRKVTSNQLRMLGANQIVTASNGAEALELLRRQRVDVILSDWYMPTMSGLELLKAVRGNAKLQGLPFIMITAEAERERVAEAIANGVNGLLVKPYSTEQLGQRLEKAMAYKPRAAGAATPVTPRPAAAPAPAAKPPKAPTILIVDDTPDNLHLLSHMFKDEYLVRVANNGQKALDICCSDDPPDLVLLDIMMPGMDGFEVAQRMREHPSAENIPVIFVTAIVGEDARLRGMKLGAVDFVTKPIDPEILRPRVRNFMRYVALRKQLQADYDGMLDAASLRDDVEHITRHDMKGPLAGIIGLVQTLVEDQDISRIQLTEQLRLIEETALQVLNMVNLSSELFKIETGHFQLDARPMKIGDMLQRVLEISRAAVAGKHLTLAMETSAAPNTPAPQALGDAMLCYSLFQNLVKNACEAAPPNSTVSVTLHPEDPLRIVIRNQGAVPAEIRGRFFEKFVTQGKHDGTGLGTYSAKLLAQAQGGSVALDANDDTNTTEVTVFLPRAPA